jgi:hypothetical protein
MRRSIPLLTLILIVPLSLLAQHTSGGSSSSSGSSGGSSSSAGGGGGSHSSAASSSGGGGGGSSHASGTSGGGTSSRSSASSSNSGGGARGGSGSTATTHSHAASTRGSESRLQPVQPRRGDRGESTKRPVHAPGEPPEKAATQRHGLFAFLSAHAATKPPCRGKNCPAACGPGQVPSKGGSCIDAASRDEPTCSTAYGSDPLAYCGSPITGFGRCSGPSAGVLNAQQQEVERLRLARESACSQSSSSQSCNDLSDWYSSARQRLEELQAEAARCR